MSAHYTLTLIKTTTANQLKNTITLFFLTISFSTILFLEEKLPRNTSESNAKIKANRREKQHSTGILEQRDTAGPGCYSGRAMTKKISLILSFLMSFKMAK